MGHGRRSEARADAGLRGAVVGYHGYRRVRDAKPSAIGSGDPAVSLMISFYEGAILGAPAPPLQVVAVPVEQPHRDAVLARGFSGVQIDMTPMGASRLIGVSAEDLARGDLDAASVLGADLAELLNRLRSAATWQSRFAAVDTFLLARVASAPPRSLLAGAVWRRFAEAAGMAVLGELASITDSEEPPADGMRDVVHAGGGPNLSSVAPHHAAI